VYVIAIGIYGQQGPEAGPRGVVGDIKKHNP
jgi:hypothetical protein